jgi:protein-L-isoaspartate(D-aspartate) O-methyltransferase
MSDASKRLRASMIDDLRRRGLMIGPPVEAALRSVPRHAFLPETTPEQAYADQPVVTKWADGIPVSSASQPAIVAHMLEQLGVEPGQRVLEIGAGTGYNAALLSCLVGPSGVVTTVDIASDVTERARNALTSLGFDNVRVVCADGGLGYAPDAPYDRVIVTVGAWDLPPAWFAQLSSGGRLVVPLGLRGPQRSIAFEYAGGCWRSRSIVDCGFMAMQGEFASPGRLERLGPLAELAISVDDGREIDSAGLYASLHGSSVMVETDVTATADLLSASHCLWVALTEPDACWLTATAGAVGAGLIDPPMDLFGDGRAGMALVCDDSLALAVRHGGGIGSGRSRRERYRLDVEGYGSRAGELAARMARSLRDWDAYGKPDTERLRVEVHPPNAHDEELAGKYLLGKHSCQLAISWT